MSLVSNNRPRAPLGRSGTVGLQFALVAIPFVLLLLAGMDLGRYFITEHSLRTLVSEAVRATLVTCYGSSGTCNLPSANKTTVAAQAPFLNSGSITWVTANQSAPNSNGERTISVTVSYPFIFVLPAWSSLNASSPITQSISFKY